MSHDRSTLKRASLICDAVADVGAIHPWRVRLLTTLLLVEELLQVSADVRVVQGAVFARIAQSQLGADVLLPASQGELDQLREQFGRSFAALGFDATHALISTPAFQIECARATDMNAGLLPLGPRILEQPLLDGEILVDQLPFGCVAAYRTGNAQLPGFTDEERFLASRLRGRVQARLRWYEDGERLTARSA